MNLIAELKQKRFALIEQAEALYTAADTEKRKLTDEEREKFKDLMAQADELEKEIREREEIEKRKFAFQQPPGPIKPDPSGGDPNIGMDDKDLRNYSLVRAIRAAVAQASGEPNAWREAGLELEASRAVAERMGIEPRGFFVPYDWQVAQARDLVKYDPASGGYTVATELLVASFIEMLRNKMMVRQAGASVLTGLVGDVAIPRQAGGATAYWIGEGKAPTKSEGSFEQVALSPKTVAAFTDLSRKLIKQSGIDVELFVRNDLSLVLALAIDYAALHGAGAGNEPQGIQYTAGIGSVAGGADGGAPDWGDVVDLETEVAVDNADVGRLAYMTNSKVRGKLKKTMRTATYGDIPIWEVAAGPQPLNGYPVHVTNQVRSDLAKGSGTNLSAIFFGNWADLIIGMWGTLDILVDPYSGSTAGTVRVVAHQDVDVAVRHPESFSAMLDAITT